MEKSWKLDWRQSPGNSSRHYDPKSEIQPIQYFASDYQQHLPANVIKYVLRHDKKNGKEDLEKARWYVDWLNRSMGYREVHAGDFLAANKLETDVIEIILGLERFEELKNRDPVSCQALLKTIDNHIVNLIKKYYE